MKNYFNKFIATYPCVFYFSIENFLSMENLGNVVNLKFETTAKKSKVIVYDVC